MSDINPIQPASSYSSSTGPNLTQLAANTQAALTQFRDHLSDLMANPQLVNDPSYLKGCAESINTLNACVQQASVATGGNTPQSPLSSTLKDAANIANNILTSEVYVEE